MFDMVLNMSLAVLYKTFEELHQEFLQVLLPVHAAQITDHTIM